MHLDEYTGPSENSGCIRQGIAPLLADIITLCIPCQRGLEILHAMVLVSLCSRGKSARNSVAIYTGAIGK